MHNADHHVNSCIRQERSIAGGPQEVNAAGAVTGAVLTRKVNCTMHQVKSLNFVASNFSSVQFSSVRTLQNRTETFKLAGREVQVRNETQNGSPERGRRSVNPKRFVIVLSA